MIDAQLARIMHALKNGEAQSIASLAKKTALAQSELRRLLTVLGENEQFGSLGLIVLDHSNARTMISLSERGKTWILQNH